MDHANLKLLFSSEAIRERVRALARELNAVYGRGPVVVVCVLNGAALFFADLVRLLDADVAMEFSRLSSYGTATESSGLVRMEHAWETDLAGRHVLVLEDIVDTGLTLEFLMAELRRQGPASIRVCAMVDKVGRRRVDVPVDHCGFRIKDGFVVGYGMDLAGRYRALDAIYEIVDSSAQ